MSIFEDLYDGLGGLHPDADQITALRAALAAEQARAERAEAALDEAMTQILGCYRVVESARAALALRPSGDGVG